MLRIVEGTDASEEEQRIGEINSSIYVFRADALWPALERIEPHNAQGELYLTDAIEILVADGGKVAAHVAPDSSRGRRASTRASSSPRRQPCCATGSTRRTCSPGVTIVDPQTTWIEPTVEIEPDVTIQPFTILRGATRVADRCRDRSQHRRDRRPHRSEGDDRPVLLPSPWDGPRRVFQGRHLRGDQEFTRSATGTKVPHLSYIGDAEIGDDTNVGAGAITANFPHKPGEPKGRTTIGSNVRTGIHNGFVAPVEVGDGAWIAAGSVITKDVPADALGIARPRQENKEGYAARQRDD